jgi:hypothetical protein
MGRLPEGTILNLKNKSHTITADIQIGDQPANGVIIAQGGAFGGWCLYLKKQIPKYCYNLFGLSQTTITGQTQLTPGTHQLAAEFAYDGGGLGKGATITLTLDGTTIGRGRLDATTAIMFSLDETTDLGKDHGSAVSHDYTPQDSDFTDTIHRVELTIGNDSHDPPHHPRRQTPSRHHTPINQPADPTHSRTLSRIPQASGTPGTRAKYTPGSVTGQGSSTDVLPLARLVHPHGARVSLGRLTPRPGCDAKKTSPRCNSRDSWPSWSSRRSGTVMDLSARALNSPPLPNSSRRRGLTFSR